jgi:hypothetical protein
MALLSDQENVIMITRPVNPDGTELIVNGAATKSMDVKPKSSNWGPQKGFLPVNQRYSKLWKAFTGEERKHKIEQYNAKAQENLQSGITLARALKVTTCSGPFFVYVDQNKFTGEDDDHAEDEIVLIPETNPNKVCYWQPEFSSNQYITQCVPRGPQHALVPLQVMASPQVHESDGITPRFITADYDLLMVGFYEGEDQGPPDPPDLPFTPGLGQITPEQIELLYKINTAVQQSGYTGGNVVHHGPENQFSASPYIDYPLTVFAPDDIPNGLFNTATDGLILSIKMGPPGYRDMNLKSFVNKMRKAGYDLYDNPTAPGWHWTWNSTAEGYQLEDHEDIDVYIEEVPQKQCPIQVYKSGETDCPPVDAMEDNSPLGKNNKPFTGSEDDSYSNYIIAPNPVSGSSITFHLNTSPNEIVTWKIVDAYGHLRNSGISENRNLRFIKAEVGNLESGMYTVFTDQGMIGRFIKL